MRNVSLTRCVYDECDDMNAAKSLICIYENGEHMNKNEIHIIAGRIHTLSVRSILASYRIIIIKLCRYDM